MVGGAFSSPGDAGPALWKGVREQLLRRNVKRFRGGLVFKAHRLLYHSTLGWREIKKKKKEGEIARENQHHLPHGAVFKSMLLYYSGETGPDGILLVLLYYSQA